MTIKYRLTLILITLLFQQFIYSLPEKYIRNPSFYDTLPNVKKGGELNFSLISDPKVINPVLSNDASSSSIEGYLWMPLMTMDSETLQYLPALAQSYTISEDKKDYTFYLNPNAKWQDGSSVTAIDIKFTFDTIMNPKVNAAVLRSYLSGISASTKDNLTIVFHIDKPRFDNFILLASFVPIQKKQFENSLDFNQDKGIMHPVGNGPYVLKSFERGHKIVFERSKNWWGYMLPHFKNKFNIDQINIRIIADTNLTYEKFLQGAIDETNFTPEQWRIKVTGLDKQKFSTTYSKNKKVWAIKLENKFPKSYSYIAWNEKNPIFSTVKTRTAISFLVNYSKISKEIFYDLNQQTTSPFGSLSPNAATELRNPDKIISFNKAKALSLLKEDGWKNGGNGKFVKDFNGKLTPLEFTLMVPTQSSTGLKIAQVLKQDFKNSGVILNIKSIEWNTFLDKVEKRDFDSLLMAWTSSLFPNAKQIWHSQSQGLGGSNFIGYNNPKVDELIDKSNQEFNPLKRNQIMQEINRLIYMDQPYTFLFEPKYILEGLNTKINSPKWVTQYSGGAESELFYIE